MKGDLNLSSMTYLIEIKVDLFYGKAVVEFRFSRKASDLTFTK